ncbi:MAG: 4-hydroxy-tetrahydrodipicolinate reductase [Candidatus Gastranaerophilaceae bacterium]
MIKVAVCGSCGKMGQEVIKAVIGDPELELVAKIDLICLGEDIFDTIEKALEETKIDVLVDFTQPNAIFKNAKFCLENGIRPVIGTTGLSDEQISNLEELSSRSGVSCFIAPNFSTGAVLMMMFSAQAAKYFDNAEIIEYHHNQKKDAPSGTAIKTAKMMELSANKSFAKGNCEEQELIKGSRGGISSSDIHIHSVRMPGYIASQEVIFGSEGQTLKVCHDSMDRTCYMSGVLLAIKHVMKNDDFVYGLENIL